MGLILILSTPISGFVSYAITAILVGEERLEGANGLTALGWIAIGIPAILGLAVVLWSRTTVPLPGRKAVAMVMTGTALAIGAIGARSAQVSSEAGDASIGGGLAIIFAIALLVVAALLGISSRNAPR